jgi:glycosyltransferase involved in cell wall biosynthesis
MKVLMITGDSNFASSGRFALQARVVEQLAVVYWGRGAWWPAVPPGQFDVVTAQDPLLRGAFARRAAKKIGARFNVQVHMDLDALPWWKHALAHIILRHADTVRVVSEKIKAQVLRMAPQAKVHVLPIYIGIAPFAKVLPQPHVQKTILWIGRFEEEKDPMLAIEVLKSVPDAKLIMLGKGSLESVLRHAAKGLAVEFPGWQDPKPFLAQADVVLSTSAHESYGASIIEALAAKVPVVAPDVGIAREAGAIVVPRSELARTVDAVLRSGARGELRLLLPTADAWAQQWKETLT